MACKPDSCPEVPMGCVPQAGSLTDIPFDVTPATLAIPSNFPPMVVPPDNPITEQGIDLGRRLFYDPILSADSTQSCFSCHLVAKGFADGQATSAGIDNIRGTRSAMPLLNLAYNNRGFFWDGRTGSLESQALLPVEDEIELHDTWENVICKLTNHENYPAFFRQTFGIEDKNEITKELVAKALAQFQRSIIVGNSKYDRFQRGEVFLEADELNGRDMFFDLAFDKNRFPDAECAHCHGGPLLTFNEFRNNGIAAATTLEDFLDLGQGEVTGILADNGKFRVPTLRNIELTAPYMHDGSLETLEDVIEHYSSGGQNSPNKDPLIYPIGLDSIQRTEIIAFLKILTDTSVATNPAYQNPF